MQRDMGALLGLIAHDLRNPAATIGANLSFSREVGASAEDAAEIGEALADAQTALADLVRGLDHLFWIGRWIAGEPAVPTVDGDVRIAVASAAGKVDGLVVDVAVDAGETGPLLAHGGGSSARLWELLLRNAYRHAATPRATVALARDGDAIVVEVCDDGPRVPAELREAVFSVEGQQAIKTRSDGRYSRAAGLLAAKALADGFDASIEACHDSGPAFVRVRLAAS